MSVAIRDRINPGLSMRIVDRFYVVKREDKVKWCQCQLRTPLLCSVHRTAYPCGTNASSNGQVAEKTKVI